MYVSKDDRTKTHSTVRFELSLQQLTKCVTARWRKTKYQLTNTSKCSGAQGEQETTQLSAALPAKFNSNINCDSVILLPPQRKACNYLGKRNLKY